MTLIVEDGTGLPTAESYVSVADATDYHLARRNDAWLSPDVDDEFREAALRRATEYVDSTYWMRWPGYLAKTNQGLAWPRQYARPASPLSRGYLPSDAVPQAVIRATCECALRELESPGSLAPDTYPGERVVSETVGPLSVDYADGGASTSTLPVLTAVERLLAPVLKSAAATGLVLRA